MVSQSFLFLTACLGLVWLCLLGVAVVERVSSWWSRRRRLARARDRVRRAVCEVQCGQSVWYRKGGR